MYIIDSPVWYVNMLPKDWWHLNCHKKPLYLYFFINFSYFNCPSTLISIIIPHFCYLPVSIKIDVFTSSCGLGYKMLSRQNKLRSRYGLMICTSGKTKTFLTINFFCRVDTEHLQQNLTCIFIAIFIGKRQEYTPVGI